MKFMIIDSSIIITIISIMDIIIIIIMMSMIMLVIMRIDLLPLHDKYRSLLFVPGGSSEQASF